MVIYIDVASILTHVFILAFIPVLHPMLKLWRLSPT
jgi:hypothetical protein